MCSNHNQRTQSTSQLYHRESLGILSEQAYVRMTKEQYENFHLYMPIIASVWNSLPNSTTGISPFELEHGMKPRTISDSMVEEPQTEGTAATADDLASIATSAKAFQRIAIQATALNKVLLAQKLNERGRPKHTF